MTVGATPLAGHLILRQKIFENIGGLTKEVVLYYQGPL